MLRPTTTRSTRASASIRASTEWRQSVHSVYSRRNDARNSRTSAYPQPDFAQTQSCQWLRRAAASRAGTHASACESPNSTTTFVPFGSPKRQSGGADRGAKPAKQSRDGAMSARACAGVIVSAPDRTAAGREARDTGVDGRPGTVGGGGAVTEAVAGDATAGSESGRATTASSTLAATRAAPAGSERRTAGRTHRALRAGSSTKRKVSTASPSETSTAANRSPTGTSGGGRSSSAAPPHPRRTSSRQGQCHRYQLKERRPSAASGPDPSSAATPSWVRGPAATRAAAPATGRSRTTPGTRAPSLTSTAEPSTAPSPIHPPTAASVSV